MSRNETDELVDIKNAFYTGNFQYCISEAEKIQPIDPDVCIERDIFLYRSYVSRGKYSLVQSEITGKSSSKLVSPLLLMAEYFQAKTKERRESVVVKMESIISADGVFPNDTLALVAATLFSHESNYEAALRVLHQSNDGVSFNVELMAIKVQILLLMNRIDLAKKEMKALLDKDEDAIVTQLAQAWIHMAVGGSKIQDAYYIYQELIDKYGASIALLNGQASTFIVQGKYIEADSALQMAHQKDPTDPDTLNNMLVLSYHMGKANETSCRSLAHMKDSDPFHPFVTSYHQKEIEFDTIFKQYAP